MEIGYQIQNDLLWLSLLLVSSNKLLLIAIYRIHVLSIGPQDDRNKSSKYLYFNVSLVIMSDKSVIGCSA
jgi:hypothetical protein